MGPLWNCRVTQANEQAEIFKITIEIYSSDLKLDGIALESPQMLLPWRHKKNTIEHILIEFLYHSLNFYERSLRQNVMLTAWANCDNMRLMLNRGWGNSPMS